MRCLYTELAASGSPCPTHLVGEVRLDQAQDQQVVTLTGILGNWVIMQYIKFKRDDNLFIYFKWNIMELSL